MITLSQISELGEKKALGEHLESCHNGDVDAFLGELDKSINGMIRTNLKEAGRFLKPLTRVFNNLPAKYRSRLHAIRGRYYHWTGSYGPALRHYALARRSMIKVRDYPAVARLGKGFMDVYMYLGRYDEALDMGRASLRYFRRKNMAADAGQVLNNIGNVYHRMDNNRMALKYYDRAQEIFNDGGGIPLAIVEYNRANIYANMNRLGKAEKLYRSSADLYEKNGFTIARNQAIYSLAYLHFLRDEYTEAFKAFESVRDSFLGLGDSKSAAAAMLDMAEIDIQLNQYGSASMMADEVIPEFRKLGMRYEQAKAGYFAAEVRIRLGDYRQASVHLKKAEKLFTKERNQLWMGMIQISRCKLNIARKKYSAAVKAADEALRLFSRTGNRRRQLDARIARLEGLIMGGHEGAALRQTERLKGEKLAGYQSYNLYFLIGRVHYRLGQYETALHNFYRAASAVEKMIGGLYPDEVRYFFISDKYDCYRMIVDCLLELGRTDESLLTNLNALELLNGRIDRDKKLTSKIPPHLIDRREQLRAAIRKLHKSPESGQRGDETVSYYNLEQRLWTNERKIRSILYPDRITAKSQGEADYNVREFLEDDETIINYFETDSKIGAFCVNSRVNDFVEFSFKPSKLTLALRKLHFTFESVVSGITDTEETGLAADSYLREIYDMLFAPLAGKISGRKLIIIADGRFGQIPFNALKDEDNGYLMERYEICMAVNPGDLRHRTESWSDMNEGHHAVFAVSSDVLPAVSIEADQIKSIFNKSSLYIDKAADRSSLLQEADVATGFIHIAAHASRSSENPLFSRILMGDGPFFPFDLFQTGIKANLVTLSGCQTAAPGLYYGNSFSLAKAFYQAGSRYVLATLWPVADRVSALFMIKFYKSLSEKKDIFNAYSDAISSLAEVTGNPAFWSSFVLLGV